MRWDKVTIIGVGLLGGSIGLALRRHRLAREVHGWGRRTEAVRAALRTGAVHRAGLDLQEAVSKASVVVLCTPIAQMRPLVDRMLAGIKPGVIITDVGSVKAPLVRELGPRVRKAGGHFVGAHPMAGSERTGVEAAREDLFDKAVCVITPDSKTDRGAVNRVEALWRSLGCRVMRMEPRAHDRIVSRTSHLPHLLASALTAQVLDPGQDPVQPLLCATGFRDTTRIAAGAPEMWRDILLSNRGHLSRDLALFERRLARLRRMLEAPNARDLERFLAGAQRLRQAWKPGRKALSQE